MLDLVKKIFRRLFRSIVYLIILFTVVFIYAICQKSSFGIENTYKVNDKAINEGQYLIYTNHGTRTVEDSNLYMQYRSSDLYGGIEKDKCYTILKEMFTYRIPFLSMYPNIIKYKEVDCI